MNLRRPLRRSLCNARGGGGEQGTKGSGQQWDSLHPADGQEVRYCLSGNRLSIFGKLKISSTAAERHTPLKYGVGGPRTPEYRGVIEYVSFDGSSSSSGLKGKGSRSSANRSDARR